MRREILTVAMLLCGWMCAGQNILRVGFFDVPAGATDYKMLTAALAAAGNGDEVWVREGFYEEGHTFVVNEGVKVYGGFYGRETALNERNPAVYGTVLSGAQKYGVAEVSGLLDGFMITNGFAKKGGGLLLKVKGEANRCRIERNHSTKEGGGVFCEDGGRLSNCLITANTACEDGSAVGGEGGVVENCTVVENRFVDGISLSGLETPPDVCAGDTLALTVPTVTGKPAKDTVWELNDVKIDVFPYHTKKEDDDATLVCKVTGICGTVTSDTVHVVVNIKPTVEALNAPAAVCPGDTLNLATITPEVNYNRGIRADQGWKLNGSHFDPMTPVTATDNGKKLIYWAANCCGDSISPNEVEVSVKNVPVLNAIVAPTSVCSGMNLSLTAPTTNDGSGTDSPAWLLNGDTLKAPYTVTYADNGKSLWFEGYSCNQLLVSNMVRLTVDSLPKIAPLPVLYILYVGEVLTGKPLIEANGRVVTGKGWYLDDVVVVAPVTLENNASELVYKAENGCGETVSNKVDILVKKRRN